MGNNMGKKIQRIFLIIFAALLCCFSAGCSHKNTVAEDKESNKDTSISGEPEDTEELSEAEIYKRGYDLPIDSAEKEEAEQDCAEMMEAIRDIYEKADKGTSINAVISQETAIKMQQIIAEKDVPAAVSGFDVDMMNYDAMEDFLDEASAGNQSEIILYRIHTDGTVSREKFTFDGKDMYSLYTKSVEIYGERMVHFRILYRTAAGTYGGRGCIRDDTGKAAEGRVQGDGGELS